MVRLSLTPSRRLAAVLVAAHAAAAATLVPLGLPLWAKSLVAVAILASLWQALRRHAWLKAAGSIIAIELPGKDRAAFETRDGVRREGRVLGTTYVTPWLCVVNLRADGRFFACHALIAADNVEPESFRRLRVALRWGWATAD